MCVDPGLTPQELRAAADAYRALLTPSLVPAADPPISASTPVPAGAGDPTSETDS